LARVKVGSGYVDVDILELVQGYGIKGSKIGAEYLAFCPFHDDKNTPSFSIRLEGERAGKWQCFSSTCGEKGNLASLVAKLEGCSYQAALAILCVEEEAVVNPDKVLDIIAKLKSLDIEIESPKDLCFPIPKDCSKHYVEKFFTLPPEKGGRGYSKDDFNQLYTEDIMFCESGFYRNRIIIPIYDLQGNQVSFAARTLDKDVMEKYRYPRGWQKALQIAVLDPEIPTDPYICEGMFDGKHIQGIWKKTAIVTFGSSLTAVQCSKIARLYGKAYLAMDGDKAGREGACKAVNLLMQYGVDIEVLQLPEGSDPPTAGSFVEIPTISAGEYKQQWERRIMLKKFLKLGNQK
jgi:DNA primase